MYHFLHKHRYWFAVLIAVTVAALVFFQMNDDDPAPLGPINQPIQQERAIE